MAFALCCPIYSTWQGRSLYLEDLYVQPAFRRAGVSGLMFQVVCRAALAARCARVQWSCLTWNAPAVRAYEVKMRAVPLNDWRLFRFYKEDIERVASVPAPGGAAGGGAAAAEGASAGAGAQ